MLLKKKLADESAKKQEIKSRLQHLQNDLIQMALNCLKFTPKISFLISRLFVSVLNLLAMTCIILLYTITECDSDEFKYVPCESRCIWNIPLQPWCGYLQVSEMGHAAMLHSYWRGLSQLKALFEINLNQMTVNSLVFHLTGSTTIASAFAMSEKRSNLQ